MKQLSPAGQRMMSDLAQRYGVSVDAVTTLLEAVVNGHGTMAQFYHPDLGGGGQWMQGGMTMVGDMFNHGLKAKVDGLCCELSNLLLANDPFVAMPISQQSQSQGGQQQGAYSFAASSSRGSPVSLFVPDATGTSGGWWPGELGMPNASGSQNNVRYAYFAGLGGSRSTSTAGSACTTPSTIKSADSPSNRDRGHRLRSRVSTALSACSTYPSSRATSRSLQRRRLDARTARPRPSRARPAFQSGRRSTSSPRLSGWPSSVERVS